MYLGIDLHVKSAADMKNILLRNTLIGFHQLVYAAMHFVLSFPLVNSIIITGPLFVFVIDYYLNGVTINQTQILGIIVSFAGILLSING
jgi:drug/metabolite transporter (DMT)-like permease